jgi:hypothetical protein
VKAAELGETCGVTPADIESCTLADLELMYVDALWSFYHPDTKGASPRCKVESGLRARRCSDSEVGVVSKGLSHCLHKSIQSKPRRCSLSRHLSHPPASLECRAVQPLGRRLRPAEGGAELAGVRLPHAAPRGD